MEQDKLGFDESVDLILQDDDRFHRDAYFFLRDALDFTVKMLGRDQFRETDRHVRGPELLDGVRKHALEVFGPMVPTVFEEWGITRCEDIGDMVFNLIGTGTFGQSDDDRREDFNATYEFHEAFVLPFLPKASARSHGRMPHTS